MPRVLATFSGKLGDCIWSLALVRALHDAGNAVDFACMPEFAAVLPLVAAQPYVRKAFALDGWIAEHHNCGAQPRIPPTVPEGYDVVHHLTYKRRPDTTLVEHGFRMLGLRVPHPLLPFLSVEAPEADRVFASYAFSPNDLGRKEAVRQAVAAALPELEWVEVSVLPFLEAARVVKQSRFFFGCRSANYVVACGLNKQSLICEPNVHRRARIYACPGAPETLPQPNDTRAFVNTARGWV